MSIHRLSVFSMVTFNSQVRVCVHRSTQRQAVVFSPGRILPLCRCGSGTIFPYGGWEPISHQQHHTCTPPPSTYKPYLFRHTPYVTLYLYQEDISTRELYSCFCCHCPCCVYFNPTDLKVKIWSKWLGLLFFATLYVTDYAPILAQYIWYSLPILRVRNWGIWNLYFPQNLNSWPKSSF